MNMEQHHAMYEEQLSMDRVSAAPTSVGPHPEDPNASLGRGPIKDAEFTDVGPSVSGFWNFGGIKSLQRKLASSMHFGRHQSTMSSGLGEGSSVASPFGGVIPGSPAALQPTIAMEKQMAVPVSTDSSQEPEEKSSPWKWRLGLLIMVMAIAGIIAGSMVAIENAAKDEVLIGDVDLVGELSIVEGTAGIVLLESPFRFHQAFATFILDVNVPVKELAADLIYFLGSTQLLVGSIVNPTALDEDSTRIEFQIRTNIPNSPGEVALIDEYAFFVREAFVSCTSVNLFTIDLIITREDETVDSRQIEPPCGGV